MAEYIDIDTPIDVAVYQRNRRIQVTIRQILESNDAKYEPADVRPVVRGRWVKPTRVPDSMLSECSVCGFDTGAYTFNFCPNCGTDMMEE